MEGSTRCSIIWVQFDDEKIGMELRKEYARLYNSEVNKTSTLILEITRQLTIQINGRRQFPLRLGTAKTIHKAQGSIMKSAVINFGTRKK